MKSESFSTATNSNKATTYKAQKGSKDIDKLVHVTSACIVVLLWIVAETDMEEKNCWMKSFFFFVNKRYSRSFLKWRLNHWCHMDYFNDVLTTFLGLKRVSSYLLLTCPNQNILTKLCSFMIFRPVDIAVPFSGVSDFAYFVTILHHFSSIGRISNNPEKHSTLWVPQMMYFFKAISNI